jgi:hypothetical protein
MLAKIAMGFFLFAAAGTAYVLQDGFVHISVDEAKESGTHLHLVVPASLGIVAARLAPMRQLLKSRAELRNLLPSLQMAASELVKQPDFVLAEVRDGDEYVRIAKVGGGLDIQEDSPREHVRVWVPLRAVYDTAEVLSSRLSGN